LKRPMFAVCLMLASALDGAAQSAPARYDDLPKLAKDWPAPWAKLVRDYWPSQKNVAKEMLARLNAQVAAESLNKEPFPIAETILAATLRHHQSLHSNLKPDEGWLATHSELVD